MIDKPHLHRPRSITPVVTAEDRERVIGALTDRFANDGLSLEVFERRVAVAYSASTPAQLDALVADFEQPAPSLGQRNSAPLTVGAVFSNVVRGGTIAVPSHMDVRALLGNVELDLREAVFLPGVTEIVLHAFMGNIEIRLPAHVGIEDHVSAVLGSFEYRREPRSANWVGGSAVVSVVRFTGRVVMSSAEVTMHMGASAVGLSSGDARN